MSKLDAKLESAYRSQIAVAQGMIAACNKELIAGGCEPEPDTMIKGAKVVASGVIARTGSFFSNIGQNVKDAYAETKKAGEVRIQTKEIDKQVEEQMKQVKAKLHGAMGV
jgi:hypothetical protein